MVLRRRNNTRYSVSSKKSKIHGRIPATLLMLLYHTYVVAETVRQKPTNEFGAWPNFLRETLKLRQVISLFLGLHCVLTGTSYVPVVGSWLDFHLLAAGCGCCTCAHSTVRTMPHKLYSQLEQRLAAACCTAFVVMLCFQAGSPLQLWLRGCIIGAVY